MAEGNEAQLPWRTVPEGRVLRDEEKAMLLNRPRVRDLARALGVPDEVPLSIPEDTYIFVGWKFNPKMASSLNGGIPLAAAIEFKLAGSTFMILPDQESFNRNYLSDREL